MASPSGGGGSGQQTVTQVQQIPEFSQQFAQENQDIARSLASQPYPTYQAPLIAGFTPTQSAGQQAAINAAQSFLPSVTGGINATQNAIGQDPLGAVLPMLNSSAGMISGAGATADPALNFGANLINQSIGASAANPGVVSAFMSPYVQGALRPQIENLQTQIGQQMNAIGARATQAGAFGDARQGVAEALTNKYGNQALTDLVARGYDTAFENALQAAQNQQQLGVGAGSTLANLGLQRAGIDLSSGQALGALGLQTAGAGQQGQQIGLQGGAQLGNLGALMQQLGLGGANAIYNVGSQEQQLQQQQLNTAYQQFQNQANWPYQQLNVRLSALSNSPYSIANSTTLPNANMTAQNLGTFASLAGLLGSATGGAVAPFGGAPYNAATARAA